MVCGTFGDIHGAADYGNGDRVPPAKRVIHIVGGPVFPVDVRNEHTPAETYSVINDAMRSKTTDGAEGVAIRHSLRERYQHDMTLRA